MKVTYIHHSSFLVETDICYYLFDYEKGVFPKMDGSKPIFVLASHNHGDHYDPDVFPVLKAYGMEKIYPVLSEDIRAPLGKGMDEEILQVAAGNEYELALGQKLTTFKSTDEGVAFLIEDSGQWIYHAGDLNDWVWEGESEAYNEQMTRDYREQMDKLAEKMSAGEFGGEKLGAEKLAGETPDGREIDVAFVVLDPRQEKDYDRGMCYFLEKVPVKQVYPMHYWEKPGIMDQFLEEHPEYAGKITRTE